MVPADYAASTIDWDRIRSRARSVAASTRRPLARHQVTEVDQADAARIADSAPLRRLGGGFLMVFAANMFLAPITLLGVPVGAFLLVALHDGDYFTWLWQLAACVLGGIGLVGFLIGLSETPKMPAPKSITRSVVDDFWVLATHEREQVSRFEHLTRTTTNVTRYVLRRDGRLEVVMESWDENRPPSSTTPSWTSPRSTDRWWFTDDNVLMFDYPHTRERILRGETEIRLWVKASRPHVPRKGDGLLRALDGLAP